MLPQLQMHPPMPSTPSPQHHRHYLNFPVHGQPDNRHNLIHVSSALSFPIRTSQHGSSFFTNPAIPAYSEHRLRRKTPNGTIDAAYDASPLQRTDGPPPYKQMALPPSSLLPSQSPNTPVHPFSGTPAANTGLTPGSGMYDGRSTPWLWSHPQGLASALNAGLPTQMWDYSSGLHEDFPHTAVQPVLRANEYNVRAFCPPPMPPTSILPFGQLEWPVTNWHGDAYRASSLGTFCHVPCTPSVSTAHPFADYAPTTLDTWPAQALPFPPGTSYMPMAAIDNRLGDASQTPNSGSMLPQPGFRDKVLAQAHAYYMELLSYTQATRKNAQNKDGQSARNSVNLFLYPKPPNPSHRQSFGTGSLSNDASYALPGGPGSCPASVNSSVAGRYVTGHGSSFATTGYHNTTGYQSGLSKLNSRWCNESSNMFTPRHGSTPADNASASLDVITSLCEQSGWKWTEGMLLGGCLLYALGRYNEAFKWFSRVFAIDQGYVNFSSQLATLLMKILQQAC